MKSMHGVEVQPKIRGKAGLDLTIYFDWLFYCARVSGISW